MVLEFERLVSRKADESIGNAMIYEVCEALREKISDMNEMILNKLRELNEKDSIDHGLKQAKFSQDASLTFTPVNSETFAKWCDSYKERMHKMKAEQLTERDLKPTGKQVFEMRKNIIEDIKLDEEEEDDEDFTGEGEPGDDEGEDEEDAIYYDKALYQ